MLKKPVIQKFDKDLFKNSVVYNVKTLYRKTLEEATQQQIFQAVSYAIKDIIVDNWMNTQKEYQKEDPKTVYYLSMEFLMGRALGNNLINLQAYEDVEEALEELGIDINTVEDQEPDPALGNGGLGRLAACFLDSLATLGYAAYGCGIRSNRKSGTAIRLRCRTTGWPTAILLNSAVRNMPRRSSSADMLMFLWMKTDATALSRRAISL